MYSIAFICLVMSMLLSFIGGFWACIHLWGKGRAQNTLSMQSLERVEYASSLVTVCLLLASAILVYALVSYDFSLVYVASYTDRILPVFYRITAFWGGQAGSLLFWALSVAVCGSIFQFTAHYKDLSIATRLWYNAFYLAIMGFFGLLLITWNNPFLLYSVAPADGNGLNPLLQHPGMIFHPPLLFLGYGGFVVPGCLALAQSLSKQHAEKSWTQVARPFTLSAWGFLTAGIILGAWWAYMELGWGGYWAWDPVENASLIPWLLATAALHTIVLQERRNKLYATNVFLMALTTISAFFATYLVRSGVIQSVHAFGSGGVGNPLLLFIFGSTVMAFWIACKARRKEAAPLDALTSREGALVVTAWLLLVLAVIILVATLWPVLGTFWQNLFTSGTAANAATPMGLTADFYNRACLPLFALMAALLALCPWLGWDGEIRQKMYLAMVVFILISIAAALWIMGYRVPVAVFAAGAGLAAGVSALLNMTAPKRAFRARAAWGVHLGLALIVIGVAFSGPFKLEINALMQKGDRTQVGEFTVHLANIYTGKAPGYTFLEAELEVYKENQLVGIVAPQRRIHQKWEQMQFAEAANLPSLGNEFYASLLSIDEQNRVRVSLSSTPLVNWLWIGGILMSLLPFCMLRRQRASKANAKG